jgi:putative transposase
LQETNQKEAIGMDNDMNKLPHTVWNCKYHIAFAPKYRRQVFYGQKKAEIGKICTINTKTESFGVVDNMWTRVGPKPA